jgi:hypothetical protein
MDHPGDVPHEFDLKSRFGGIRKITCSTNERMISTASVRVASLSRRSWRAARR